MGATSEIHTQRLVLKTIKSTDANEAWPHVNDERMWTYFPHLRPASVLTLRELYDKWERGSPTTDEIWLNFFCRERSSGSLVGAVQSTILPSQHIAYVAYAIYPRHQGRGFAREAVGALIRHVHETLGIGRYLAEVDVRNEPSCRVVEALGFTQVLSRAGEYVYELHL